VRFLSFLCRKLLFQSYAAQCSQCSDLFCLQAALPFIRLMKSTGILLCPFVVFACRKWRRVMFLSIDHCIVCWPCCWARCWMLQDMDHMEASRVFYVKVCTFDQHEQSTIFVLTIISSRIVKLTIYHDLLVIMCFMNDPGDVLRQTSPNDLPVEEFPFNIYQTWDISWHSLQCIPATKQRNNTGPTNCKLRDHWNHL